MYNHPDHADRLCRLGDIYCKIYERTKDLDTLEFALKCYQDALGLTSHDHPDKADRYLSLGNGYQSRYCQNGVLADIQTAIQNFEKAIHLTPEDHPKSARQAESLGYAYFDMYGQTKSIQHLERSIELFQQALDLMPIDRGDRADLLQFLGDAYLKAYKQTVGSNFLELAIGVWQLSLDLTPHDHPFRAYRLYGLGFTYETRYHGTKAPEDLATAIELYHEGLHRLQADPNFRLRFGRRLLYLYAQTEDWLSAYEVANLAIPLVTLLAPRSLELSDRQNLVNVIAGLASDAAAITIKAGRSVYDALEILENGRSIISSAINDMRMDTSQLTQSYPQLAQRFDSLRGMLDNSKHLSEEHDRHDVGRELERLILEIRTLAGFDRFLLAPSEEEFKAIAFSGPIVLVNVSAYGCHAFIIEQERLQALELTDIREIDIRDKAILLECPDAELLEWLWNTIACPILDALGYTKPSTMEGWPRIWWIPTGILTKFPLHAAGYHAGGQTHNTVMDRVISSYSSSVKALEHSRRDIPTSLRSLAQKSMVVVGMTQTPGHATLHFAQKETEALINASELMQMELSQPVAHRNEVLSAIADCQIFHFAGHGCTDPADPSQSGLILNDGRLTVESIFSINLHQHKPFLAYLSACGTGRVQHDDLADESLHTTGACQLAGFQHVIGTLWEVDDESCVNIAETIYQWIQRRAASDVSVSEGLHHAIREARDRWSKENTMRSSIRRDKKTKTNECRPSTGLRDVESIEDAPLYWVPYVHYGT